MGSTFSQINFSESFSYTSVDLSSDVFTVWMHM